MRAGIVMSSRKPRLEGKSMRGTLQAILVLVDDPNGSVVVIKIFTKRAASRAEQGLHIKMRDHVIVDFEQQPPTVSFGKPTGPDTSPQHRSPSRSREPLPDEKRRPP